MTQTTEPTANIFTIGHSNLEIEALVGALQKHSVGILCDVRSRPASSRFPQFNREPLEEALRDAGLRYEFLGEELGGRPEDPHAYRADGLADYAKRRQSRQFETGVERVIGLAQTQRVAMMCAEEDPLECHRFLLICPAVVAAGTVPEHIRRGGVLESQLEAEDRLLSLHGFTDVMSSALFADGREAALEDAFRRQSEKFAFRLSPEAIEYL